MVAAAPGPRSAATVPVELATKSEPMGKLSREILLDIFSLNANMEGDSLQEAERIFDWKYRGLTTILSTSQVCRLWRDLVLSSTSFWGRVIDLSYLCHAKPEGREEILRRTGSAPLWLKGEYVVKDDTTANFLISLLTSEWERIVNIHCALDWGSRYKIWDTLKRPSAVLRGFRLHPRSSPYLGKFKLFDNDAPLLTKFLWVDCLSLGVDYPWISQLRHFDIFCERGRAPNLAYWLNQLRLMEHLEVLTFKGHFRSQSDSVSDARTFPTVHLPRLTALNVEVSDDNLPPMVAFLDRVSVEPECRVRIRCTKSKAHLSNVRRMLYEQSLTRYAAGAASKAKSLSLSLFNAGFALQIPYSSSQHSALLLDALVSFHSNTELTEAFRPINSFSHRTEFAHLTILRFEYDGSLSPPTRLEERFLYSLVNIETLYTTPHTLDQVMKLPGTLDGTYQHTPFPKLQTIFSHEGSATLLEADPAAFFKRRVQEGRPIRTLHVPRNGPHYGWHLEDVDGLTVVFMESSPGEGCDTSPRLRGDF